MHEVKMHKIDMREIDMHKIDMRKIKHRIAKSTAGADCRCQLAEECFLEAASTLTTAGETSAGDQEKS